MIFASVAKPAFTQTRVNKASNTLNINIALIVLPNQFGGCLLLAFTIFVGYLRKHFIGKTTLYFLPEIFCNCSREIGRPTLS